MKKTIAVFLSLLFVGGLMIWTMTINIALLTRVSGDPQFVFFGILSLEGGIVFWTAMFLLNENGVHKGMSAVMIGIDVAFSLTGFFLQLSHVTDSKLFVANLPAIPFILALNIAFNIVCGILVHLMPDDQKVDIRPLVEAAQNGYHKVTDRRKKMSLGQIAEVEKEVTSPISKP